MSFGSPWMTAELGYVRHLLRFILESEVEDSAILHDAVGNLLINPGKLLRPRFAICGARLACGGTAEMVAQTLPPQHFDPQELVKIKKKFRPRFQQRPINLTMDAEYDTWKNSAPFPGALPNHFYLLTVAMEMLHLASLVHDDVIDQSPLRRGRPSAMASLGNNVAVLLGDLLFTLCLSLVNECDNASVGRILSGMVRLMVKSELAQAQDRLHLDALMAEDREIRPSRRHYLRIIGGKTALLFAMSISVGAGVMEGSQKLLGKLQTLGYLIGLTFQMVDDTLDLKPPGQKFDKRHGQDLLEGQITLPIMLGLAHANSQQLKRAIVLYRQNQDSLESVCALLDSMGIFTACQREINTYYQRAKRLLHTLRGERLPEYVLAEVDELLDFIIHRDY